MTIKIHSVSEKRLTRGATVTGRMPVISFVVRDFISMINKVKMQESRHVIVKHGCPRLQQS